MSTTEELYNKPGEESLPDTIGSVDCLDQSVTFAVSNFNNCRDNCPKPNFLTWKELCEMFESPVVRAEKDGPAFSPASFEPKKRKSCNATGVSMAVYDIDHLASIESILESLNLLECAYIVGSTHSHMREVPISNPLAEPRFRVVIPFVVPVPSEHFNRVWQSTKGVINLPVDEGAKDIARLYYKPAKVESSSPYVCHLQPGRLFDWRDVDVVIDIGAAKNTDADQLGYESPIHSGSRNNSLMRIAGKLRHAGMEAAQIQARLIEINSQNCKPPLEEKEIASIVQSTMRYRAGTDNSPNSPNSRPLKQKLMPQLEQAALIGPVGDVVRIISPHTEATDPAILIQLLSAFGILIGRSAYYLFGRDEHYTKDQCRARWAFWARTERHFLE